jgi:hypothetical protein
MKLCRVSATAGNSQKRKTILLSTYLKRWLHSFMERNQKFHGFLVQKNLKFEKTWLSIDLSGR